MELIKKNWNVLWRVTILIFAYFGLAEMWDHLYGKGVSNNSPSPTSHQAPAARPPVPERKVETKKKESHPERPCVYEQLDIAPPSKTLKTFHGTWKQRGDLVTFGHGYQVEIQDGAGNVIGREARRIDYTFNVNDGQGSWTITKKGFNQHGTAVLGEVSPGVWEGVRFTGKTGESDEHFRVKPE